MPAATAAGDVGARQIAPHHVYDSSRLENPVTRELRELWARRRLLRFLVARDMTLRYKRSVLGVCGRSLSPYGDRVSEILRLVDWERYECWTVGSHTGGALKPWRAGTEIGDDMMTAWIFARART